MPEPLSADLITISVRFLSVLRALRSFLERLLRIGVGLQVMMSFSIALHERVKSCVSSVRSPGSPASEAFHFIRRIS